MVSTNVKLGVVISNPNNRNLFNKYLQEISQYKSLTRDEEVQLFKELENSPNDRIIIDKIYKHNLLFVVSIAKRYSVILNSASALTLEDLINDGNVGLHSAINRFDYKTGYKFISYAVWWIKQSIIQSIQHNFKTIRIPGNIRSSYTKITKKQNQLEQRLGRSPSTIEIYDAMILDGDVNESIKIDEIVNFNSFETSLNTYVGDEEKTELITLIKDESELVPNKLIDDERKALAFKILDSSTNLMKAFLIDYFGLDGDVGLTIKQISNKYDLSASVVKNRIDKELKRIRFRNKENRKFFFPKENHYYASNWKWRG